MQTADLNSLQVCVYCIFSRWKNGARTLALPVLIHASLEIRGAVPVQSVLLVGRRPRPFKTSGLGKS